MSQPAPISTSGPTISSAGYDVSPLSEEEVMDLAKALNAEERQVLLNHGTEPAFCGNLLDNKKQGTYACCLCGLPLFASKAKFESGTGWPSFYQPVDRAHLAYIEDRSGGMVRTEIRCARCGGHLGHVFPDGPPPTRERYCLNSVSMEFVDSGQPLPRKTGTDRAPESSRAAGG
jgi:peptide-methionine (R)-S-oxide reductase